MKKTLIILLSVLLIFGLFVSCKPEPEPEPVPETFKEEITKVADYLYKLNISGYGEEAPATLTGEYTSYPFGGSAVRNGNFFGCNFDSSIDKYCQFIVQTEATAKHPHATIGVANPYTLNIKDEDIDGLTEDKIKLIPWFMTDGINDAGLTCSINGLDQADIKDNPHSETNQGAPKIYVVNLVRALLDNCGSVEEAKTYIESHDIIAPSENWDCHIMIADPNKTVIVEFTGNGIKFIEQDSKIMTDFYNHLKKGENFPAHPQGMERYTILSDNYNTGNSMQGMWELLKKVRYTQAYDKSVDPFWSSEYYNTTMIPTFDNYDKGYWTKGKVLAEENPAKLVAAYVKYQTTGEYKADDGLWFTEHNSTYDIQNKKLWVSIREKYDTKPYEFELGK